MNGPDTEKKNGLHFPPPNITQREQVAAAQNNHPDPNHILIGQERSDHPQYIKKEKVRIKLQTTNGLSCFGNCHVLWPDGRVSDVINDERPFLILTEATVQGDSSTYDILTINKNNIEMLFEIHRHNHPPTED